MLHIANGPAVFWQNNCKKQVPAAPQPGTHSDVMRIGMRGSHIQFAHVNPDSSRTPPPPLLDGAPLQAYIVILLDFALALCALHSLLYVYYIHKGIALHMYICLWILVEAAYLRTSFFLFI